MLFQYSRDDVLGTVESVDTSTVIVRVDEDDLLKNVQVNHLVVIQSSKIGQCLIGLVSKVIRKSAIVSFDETEAMTESSVNMIKIVLIGTFFDNNSGSRNLFSRTLTTVPAINAECYLMQGDKLKQFMMAISSVADTEQQQGLNIGTYSVDDEAKALINGNKFFQRHAVIVGSTGSGKSWCVARILEQVARLKSADAILFDIHGEYTTLNEKGFSHLKIAGPQDNNCTNDIIFLPYWLLTYEEVLSLLLDRSDNNAPNQAMLLSSEIINGRNELLKKCGKNELSSNITLDSPVPYELNELVERLNAKDTEMVKGLRGDKQGAYYGKLTRFIQRLEAKIADKRLNFMFNGSKDLLSIDYMTQLCEQLMKPSEKAQNGVKIIDFSEVPSDILPLIVGLVARIVFTVQQWTNKENRHPIALFCDEAHLYVPNEFNGNVHGSTIFERVSKEGRKYGVGLVIISQRPSEVNRTVLSQCNNFISMRLTNADDQSVIKKLLPDSLGDYVNTLPVLDIGEALIVGDASILPCRIKIAEPELKPKSSTIDFWNEWSGESGSYNIKASVEALIKQCK